MPANDKIITFLCLLFAIILFIAGTKLYNISIKDLFSAKSIEIISPIYDFNFTLKDYKKNNIDNEKINLQKLYEIEQKLEINGQNKNDVYNIISRLYLQKQLADFLGKKLSTVISKNNWELTYNDLAKYDFDMPIKNGILIYNEYFYPGALRRYRNGIHQGIDISYTKDGIKQPKGTPIYSISEGIVVKITDYQYYSHQRDYFQLLSICSYQKYTDDKYLDIFRGKQVQVKTENLLIIYCHLDDFNKELKVGQKIYKGNLIGFMGNSGVEYIGSSPHLHLELYLNGFIIGVNRSRNSFDYSYNLIYYMFNKK
ncbi:MAG: M23 family metallopeptidase [Spirochaetota bacterium]